MRLKDFKESHKGIGLILKDGKPGVSYDAYAAGIVGDD